MKILFKILFLLLIGFSAKAQLPAPSGFPAPYSTGYYRIGWLQSDSGSIPAYRDTFWIPKFQGTEILWIHVGVDTSKWIRIGTRWVKELKAGDLPNLTATLPIVYNNGNISCPTCGTGAGGIISLNGLSVGTQTFATGTVGTDFGISSSGSVHTFNIPNGGPSARGLIIPSDWTNFNTKQPQLNGIGFVKATGTTISYDNTVYYPNSNPNAFIPLTALSALAPALYNNATGVISVDTSNGLTHLATQAYVLSHQSSGTINGAGNLVPIFTTSIVSNTLVFTLSNAAANSILGNNTGSSNPPTYFVPNSTTLNNWFGATIGTVTGVSNADGTLTISPATGAVVASLALGHANTWTGKQTQPAPIFTGTASGSVNDSILSINPSTGQVTWRSGAPFFLTATQGLYAINSTTIGLGGNPFTLPDTIKTASQPFLITGLPNAVVGAGDSAVNMHSNGQLFKSPVPTGGGSTNVWANAPGTGNYTVAAANAIVLADLTGQANRLLVLPASPTGNQVYLLIYNPNASAFSWSFSGATVKNSANVTVTSIPNVSNVFLNWDNVNNVYREN